ncbi:MAG: flagellar basal body rod protein FlgB [Vicinamibacterales bacterium]|nr:flagellar basal body rod protein FlgB [Vicinamibacterales bacterium]
MSEISDASLIAALRRTLASSVARQNVAAGNLANLNTPGYKARESRFDDALQEQLTAGARLKATDAEHLKGTQPGIPTEEVRGLPTRRDGNNVQLDRELLQMTSASGEFQRAQTALSAKFRLVRYAISEGR